jgi:glycosyltransferase involved in cell wall biosynthesis
MATPQTTPRISVLHLLHSMAYGGIETVLINWARGLDPAHFDVHVTCFANPGGTEGTFVEAAQRHGLHVSTIPWGRRKPLFKAARALAGLIREYRVDIVHAHGWYADFVCAIAARLVPIKTITTAYVWFDYDWKRNLIQTIDQYVIRGFDQITAHCEHTRLATVARGIPAARVKTLISGFATRRAELSREERQIQRQARGAEDTHVVLVNVARLYPEKAHDMLLRSFAAIVQRCPDTRLWIAGIGPLQAELARLCAQLHLETVVTFLGFVDDLPTLLALADIQVHPAHIEGIPLAVCEGMAASLPVVASAVGGLPEIIHHGRNGMLVPPGDEARFVDEVVHLIRHPEEGRRLGLAARHFMEHDYSLTTALQRVEQTYYEVMGRCASASS